MYICAIFVRVGGTESTGNVLVCKYIHLFSDAN